MRQQDRLVFAGLSHAAAPDLRALTRGQHNIDELDLGKLLEDAPRNHFAILYEGRMPGQTSK